MVLHNGKIIGQEGGTIQSIWEQLTERQQQIVQELFPYGTAADNLEQQQKELRLLNFIKRIFKR